MPKPPQGVELLFPVSDVVVPKDKKDAKAEKAAKRREALLKKLKAIEKGGDINVVDKQGQTALMLAAAANNHLAVCWLVAKGADVTKKMTKGKTAARLTKNKEIKKLLEMCGKEKLPPTPEERKENKLLEVTPESLKSKADRGDIEAVTFLIRSGASADTLDVSADREMLRSAHASANIVAFLVRNGASVQKFSGVNWSTATPESLRLLLALGMPRETDDAQKELIFNLWLNDIPSLQRTLQQHPDMAKKPESYEYACSGEAIQALLDAAGDSPDGEKIAIALLGRSYNESAIRQLLRLYNTLPKAENVVRGLIQERGYILIDSPDDKRIPYSHPGVVQAFLDAGLSPDYTFKDGESLLYLAAKAGYIDIVRALLKAGANPNVTTADSMTPLTAIFDNMHDGWRAPNEGSIVQALLKAGANPNLGDMRDCFVRSVSHKNYSQPRDKKEQSEYLTALQALLEAKVEVPENILLNFGNKDMPPAQWEKVALMLLQHGANPKAVGKKEYNEGVTTLMTAGRMGTRITQKLLDAGVDPNAVAKDGTTALKAAYMHGNLAVAELLRKSGATKYTGELFISTPECVQRMLEEGAKVPDDILCQLLIHGIWHDIDRAMTVEQYKKIATSLQHAGLDLTTAFAQFPGHNYWSNSDALAGLILAGLAPDAKDRNGKTLLMYVTPNFRHDEMHKFLIKHGTDINAQDNDGNTYLHNPEIDEETCRLLLDSGARTDIKNKDGKTALQLAREKKKEKVVKLLEERGVKE